MNAWWAKNKERMAKDPEFRAAWRAKCAEYERRRRAKRRARMLADPNFRAEYRAKRRSWVMKWYRKPEVRARVCAERREAYAARPVDVRTKERARAHERWLARSTLMMGNAAFYAVYRAYARTWWAKRRIKAGKRYRPRPHVRIPDWATKGKSVLDVRSRWIFENTTRAQRAYARELAIERKGGKVK